MSVLTRSFRWLVLAAATISGSWASAQQYHPFAEPLGFDPDWQWFAPVQLQDFQEMTSRQRARTGWYFTYDRMYQGVTRSDTEPQSGKVDFTWGNRFDFGLMGDKETGWNFNYTYMNGPNELDTIFQNRLNVVNANDTGDYLDPLFPRDWRNDPQFRERVYVLADSLNVATMKNFEANKTWRMEPYRYGGILEPLIGLRYNNFTDVAVNDLYSTGDVDLDADGTNDVTRETLISNEARTENQMLLGQIGFRYMKYSNRWTLSTDFKAFAGPNFQTQHLSLKQELTDYAVGPASGDDPLRGTDRFLTTFGGRKNNETVVGMDVRAEAAYTLTKYLDVRGGFNLIYFGRGVWRGVAPALNNGNEFSQNQSVVMPGFTFGFNLNR